MLTKRLLASTFLLAIAACGDDSSQCVGHLCGSDIKLTDADGGNILLEYIYLDTELQAIFQGAGLPAGTTTITRAIAYFLNNQSPSNNPLPMPGVCNSFDDTKGWPMFAGTTHEDLDVGTVKITGKNTAGQDVVINVPKQAKGLDNIGRPHDIFYQTILPKAEENLQPNSSYTLEIGGNGVIAQASLKDQFFMAQTFQVSSPGFEENGPLKATADFPVHWTAAESTNAPMGTDVLGVTWLVDSKGSPTHMCPTAVTDGQFTIPAATIAEYRRVATARGTNPDKVILLRNAIVHRVARLPNGSSLSGDSANKRRVDTLTVNCWAQLMDCTAN